MDARKSLVRKLCNAVELSTSEVNQRNEWTGLHRERKREREREREEGSSYMLQRNYVVENREMSLTLKIYLSECLTDVHLPTITQHTSIHKITCTYTPSQCFSMNCKSFINFFYHNQTKNLQANQKTTLKLFARKLQRIPERYFPFRNFRQEAYNNIWKLWYTFVVKEDWSKNLE